ncbi:hypothetical protein TeGR_g6450 [Tetraparma gracilis]|uniref:Uncharacterized protein n=1 Tax=Tetraparma gracilis TaxID=2962635 RepID=A0ABQ6MB44_9STRA|nr:hypothetical protein TeGR_g6450 [Tetraparma gracilis]
MRRYVHRNRIDVPPHIFAVAEAAFRTMLSEEESQCVIISGESGAGKTEASKQIQNYIATVSASGGAEEIDQVKKVFLESNPVLESFGNAKTLRNNNSSRFGKYFELKFDRFGRPLGGKVSNFLHEKSRVVRPGPGERNFHIFYQLLAAPKETRSRYKLSKPSSYFYLSQSDCFTVDQLDDAEEFAITESAMGAVGLSSSRRDAILGVVAAVLHLGNVKFSAKQIDDAEGADLVDMKPVENFCAILGLSPKALAKHLTTRKLQTMAPGGKVETYSVPQNPAQASSRRDALCKSLYTRAFDLLVARVNSALDVKKTSKKLGGAPIAADEMLSLGVLDIYGFEIFDKNGFEQLCINYVNEKLQQIFISLTLKAEQEEYESEGITWTPIPFFNNKVVCDMIEGAKPPGLLRILDDSCKTMHSRGAKALDRGFLDNLGKSMGSHKHYQHLSSGSNSGFVIKHYAGDVMYNCNGFGESNRDALDNDLILLMQNTNNESNSAQLLASLFPEEIDLNDKRMPKTAGYKIRTQCGVLVETLSECNPHYVRCVKPNDSKQPCTVDASRVAHQAQYLGLLENIRVRRAGFAYRAEFHRFNERFGLLCPNLDATIPEKEQAKKILREVKKRFNVDLNKDEAQLGRTKLFVRQPETYFEFERLRVVAIGLWAAKIQRAWKRFSGRRHLIRHRDTMAKMYEENGKPRRRGSFCRPFDGDYLPDGDARECMIDVVRYYEGGDNEYGGFGDEKGEVLQYHFVDVVKRVEERGSDGLWNDSIVLCLTSSALYIFAEPNEDEREQAAGYLSADGDEGKQLPPLLLRRRIELAKVMRVELSKLPDDFCVIRIQQDSVMREPDRSNWMRDAEVKACMHTSVNFSLFNRRHHCRYSGQIFCDQACSYTTTLPDFGWYTPQRIYDSNIGIASTEMLEDLMLYTDRKSELVATLVDVCKKKAKNKIAVKFVDSLRLSAAPVRGMGLAPAKAEISFVSANPDRTAAFGGRLDASMKFDKNSQRYVVCVPRDGGLDEQVMKDRAARIKKRQRKLDKRRQREREARQAAAEAREAEREAERQERLDEKRRKKKAEKARREAEGGGGGEERGEEKIKAAIRRSSGGTGGGGGGEGGSTGGGAGGGGGSDQLTELQKAMAARRAKNGGN